MFSIPTDIFIRKFSVKTDICYLELVLRPHPISDTVYLSFFSGEEAVQSRSTSRRRVNWPEKRQQH